MDVEITPMGTSMNRITLTDTKLKHIKPGAKAGRGIS